jgi:hypothetical protein
MLLRGLGGVFTAALSAVMKRSVASCSLYFSSSRWERVMAYMLSEFENFPQERQIIGGLIIAYGEIEFALLACLENILEQDGHTCARILFRVRGEGARLAVADAIMRPGFQKIGLGSKWDNAFGAARICKNIRNQYAHCHWQLVDGIPHFINLDAEVGTTEGPIEILQVPLILPLLIKQWGYFEYALDWFYYLDYEYRKRAGRLPSHDLEEPKSVPAPPLYNRES